MSGQRKEIESRINDLPESFSAEEIIRMHDALKKDVDMLRDNGRDVARMERLLHIRHRVLSHAYPAIFFKTVRGELDPHMFHVMMDVKNKVDKGEMTDEDAKKSIIDNARKQVEKNPNRPKREPVKGSTIQEIVMKCKVDEK